MAADFAILEYSVVIKVSWYSIVNSMIPFLHKKTQELILIFVLCCKAAHNLCSYILASVGVLGIYGCGTLRLTPHAAGESYGQ